jgi:arabinofuranosyltransferase
LRVVLCALFAVVLGRTAWISDDAYISFRSAWNLAEGYGLRWNPAERVQAFTNPLWVLCLAAEQLVFGELYYTTLALSAVLSLGALWLVLRGSAWTAVLAGSALVLSKAFVDYSTSGLENPLTHFLLVLFLLTFLRDELDERRVGSLALLAALLAVNRLDTLILTAPSLGLAVYRAHTLRALRAALLGFAPLFAWTAFAWFYYGFPLPNTAYAKAFGLGIPRERIVEQGFVYMWRSLVDDPITLPVTAACALAALASRRPRAIAVASSMLAYLAYVVWIGGDFMTGRFLAAPLVAGVVSFAMLQPDLAPRARPGLAAALLALGIAGPTPTLLAGSDYMDEDERPHFVLDNRGVYFQKTGLSSRVNAWSPLGRVPELSRQDELFLLRAVGHAGFVGGPRMHVVDDLGLCDPLLARLPSREPERFRAGHVPRALPAGYLQAMWTGENSIEHPALAQYYAKLRLVTRGPLWSAERIAAIASFALGREDRLLRRYVEETSAPAPLREIALADLATDLEDGAPWWSPGVCAFPSGVVVVRSAERLHARRLELMLDANDDYWVVVGDELDALGEPLRIPRTSARSGGLHRRTVELPRASAEHGYTFVAVGGEYAVDGLFALGPVRAPDDR